jgi:lysozyme
MSFSVGGACVQLIHAEEGCRLVAYRDIANVPTIGWGTTHYPDGTAVKMGDTCTQEQADAYFIAALAQTALAVYRLTQRDDLTQAQIDALCCLVYNIGVGAYTHSQLRVLIHANPNNPAIRPEWMKWHFAEQNGTPPPEPSAGLWKRRWREINHYCAVETPMPPMLT